MHIIDKQTKKIKKTLDVSKLFPLQVASQWTTLRARNI